MENTRPGYQTANLSKYGILKSFQKELKKNQTPAEKALWKELQNKKTGFKFRRQHVIADHIVDFVCLRQKPVVEVDGKIHLNQIDKDMARTERLAVKGFRVIRFTNEEVLANTANVVYKIKAFIESNTIK
ncbi:MAG: endonuclease domain-containing protein [Bacteroidetes bacterium]|nr:endonuclease domain-containing protein [Bacteroidota bacterium]